MACAASEDSDQPGHPPSLIRVFAARMKKHWDISYMYTLSAQRRLRSNWADAQADLRLRWAHRSFGGFVMLRLNLLSTFDNTMPYKVNKCNENDYVIKMNEQKYTQTSSPKGNDRSPESNVPSQSAPKPYAAFPPPQ